MPKCLDGRARLDLSSVPAEFRHAAVAAVGKDTRRIVRALDRACIATVRCLAAIDADARSLLAGHSAAVAAPLIASACRNAGGVPPVCRRYASTVGAARVGAVAICFIPSHSACGAFADYRSFVGTTRKNAILKSCCIPYRPVRLHICRLRSRPCCGNLSLRRNRFP